MKDPRRAMSVESTVVLVCRDIEAQQGGTRRSRRSKAAHYSCLPRSIESVDRDGPVAASPGRSKCMLQDARAKAVGSRASRRTRTAFQVTKEPLAQKRTKKAATLGARRDEKQRPPVGTGTERRSGGSGFQAVPGTPIPSISTSTRRPAFAKRAACGQKPTRRSVPVAMTSPGRWG